jgi:hypothetical protein
MDKIGKHGARLLRLVRVGCNVSIWQPLISAERAGTMTDFRHAHSVSGRIFQAARQ